VIALNLSNVDTTPADTGASGTDRPFLVSDRPAAVTQPLASVRGEAPRQPLWAAIGADATATGRCDR
jgi:hypothetical protein